MNPAKLSLEGGLNHRYNALRLVQYIISIINRYNDEKNEQLQDGFHPSNRAGSSYVDPQWQIDIRSEFRSASHEFHSF